MGTQGTILLTGATGYIGGQLAPHLVTAGYRVRVMARRLPTRPLGPWHQRVEIVAADPLQPDTLPLALRGVRTAYYFIHSMTGGPGFRDRDITAARQFGRAARIAGVERIIYLGGLGDDRADLSEHLRSRHETGDALRQAGVPVTEFRAAIVVGAGSISFEMVRYLTERLPVMICPRWVFTKAQPIAVDDVLAYLVAALEKPATAGQTIEIGGADVLTYGQMMTRYARARGLRRLLIRVPVLTPRLSSYWVHWVTPIPAAYARPLIEGLRNEVIVRDDKARTLLPEIQPVDYDTAVRRALAMLNAEHVDRRFDQTGASPTATPASPKTTICEGMIVVQSRRLVAAPAAEVYRTVSSLGGNRDRPGCNGLWRLRGLVEQAEEDRLVRLRMALHRPGAGWIQFRIRPLPESRSELTQTVFFAPRGLLGLLWWYTLYPIHRVAFSRTLNRLAHQAATSPPA